MEYLTAHGTIRYDKPPNGVLRKTQSGWVLKTVQNATKLVKCIRLEQQGTEKDNVEGDTKNGMHSCMKLQFVIINSKGRVELKQGYVKG